MSQELLADSLGVTFQQIQKYERGANRVSASKLHEAAIVLGVAISDFFEGLPNASTAGEGGSDPIHARLATEPDLRRLVSCYDALPTDEERKRMIEIAVLLASPAR